MLARRRLSCEGLESRHLLASSATFSAYELLDQVVARGFATVPSTDALIATLSFDEVFSALSTDEVLESLIRNRLISGFDEVLALEAELARRGVSLTGQGPDGNLSPDAKLRPDGILTVLATAPGGSLLNDTSVEVLRALEADYATAPLRTLDVLEPLHLLELLDSRFSTSTHDPRQEFVAYASKATQSGLANVIETVKLAYRTVNGQSQLLSPAEAKELADLQPVGQRALRAFGIHILPGYIDGLIDPVDALGRPVEFALPWMDRWVATMERVMDIYMSEFRWRGGEVDVFLVDMENSAFSMFDMGLATSQFPTPSGRTIWEVLQADSRWPALRAELQRAGINDFSGLGVWTESDPRTEIWNSVMERRRAEYLERGLYEPVHKSFPQVRFANYGNFQHNQTLPAGSYDRFTESWAGIGSLVGTHQSKSLYGDRNAVTTPTEIFDSIPPTELAIGMIHGVNGVVTVRTHRDLTGIRVGDPIRIYSLCNPAIDAYSGNYVVSEIVDNVTLRFLKPGNYPRVELVDGVTCTGYLGTRNSFAGFVHDVKFLRTQISTSDAPLMPWISSPGWLEYSEGTPYDHWTEGVFHAALAGTNEFAFWNSLGMDPAGDGNRQMDQALAELENLIGYETRLPLTRGNVDWSDGYVLSGIEAGGKRVWRLTPDPELPFRIVDASHGVVEVGGQRVALPNSVVYSGGGGASRGVWIVQWAAESYLTQPADRVWTQIWTQPLGPRVVISGPTQAVPGQSRMVHVQLAGLPTGQQATFLVDWDGDGRFDQYASGRDGVDFQTARITPGTFRTVVLAYAATGPRLGVGSQLVDTRTTLRQTDPSVPGVTNLLVGGTPAGDIITLGSAGANVVSVEMQSFADEFASVPVLYHGVNGRVIVYGNDGDDQILAAGLQSTLEAHGGAGADRLLGGSAGDWLFGEDGDDIILGSGGRDLLWGQRGYDVLVGGDHGDELSGGDDRDVLFGGRDGDLLTGGNGEDLLLAGYTAWDANAVALIAIRNEWKSTRSLDARIANLTGSGRGTRANQNYFLLDGQTVFDDAAVDWLRGDGGTDWFLFRAFQDVVADATDNEPKSAG